MEIDIIKHEKIRIPEGEALKVAIKTIEKMFNIRRGMWLEDGNLMEEVEYTTSHRWTSDEIVRKASDQDIILIGVLDTLVKEQSKWE